jgi:hypothetical protein
MAKTFDSAMRGSELTGLRVICGLCVVGEMLWGLVLFHLVLPQTQIGAVIVLTFCGALSCFIAVVSLREDRRARRASSRRPQTGNAND